MNYKTRYRNYCARCNDRSYGYELCKDCHYLALYGKIKKLDNGEWIDNLKIEDENRFYDPRKKYQKKQYLMNEKEQEFYDFVKSKLDKKYTILPQVNLQTIVETNKMGRNDELYRNVDFCIFKNPDFEPLLAIELNGKQHQKDPYWIERDESICCILEDSGIGIIMYDNWERLDDGLIDEIHEELNRKLKPLF